MVSRIDHETGLLDDACGTGTNKQDAKRRLRSVASPSRSNAHLSGFRSASPSDRKPGYRLRSQRRALSRTSGNLTADTTTDDPDRLPQDSPSVDDDNLSNQYDSLSITSPQHPSPLFVEDDEPPSDVDMQSTEEGPRSTLSSSTTARPTKKPKLDPSFRRSRGSSVQITSSMARTSQTPPSPRARLPRQPYRRRKDVVNDPINIRIKHLRQNENLDWMAIANLLNEEARAAGLEASHTQASCYGRFVRNAPRIARASGEVGFDPADYMYLRHPHHYPTAGYLGHPDMAGERLEQHRKRNPRGLPHELRGNVRSAKVGDKKGLKGAEMKKLLRVAVERVERNFWLLVADEMEQVSGTLFEGEVLRRAWEKMETDRMQEVEEDAKEEEVETEGEDGMEE